MSHWLTQVLARGSQQNQATSPWLETAREESLAALHQRDLPTRKTEDWRYLPLGILNRFEPATADTGAYQAEPLPGLESLDLVFVNGVLLTALESLGPLEPGLTITTLADAPEATGAAVFNQVKPQRHFFGLVNDLLASTGVVISVAEGCAIKTPIRLVHWQSGGEGHTRHLIHLAKNAELCVIEQHQGSDSASLNTSFSEYQIDEGARLHQSRFALQTGNALNFGGCHFNLSDNSQLHSTLVGFGSQLARLDTDINHTGQHGHALQNAIYLLGEKELFDLHSNVEHANPNGTSEQNVRGIVGDKGKAVFNGRIHIHRYAQKTLAELNNRNLLLTRNAEVYTKPELEIYADDVRCAHGATVAELDSKALYYMQSRGISQADARIMLNFGFINELIEQIDMAPVAEWLQAALKDRISGLRHQASEE
ncbi:Fe-S cluster assembly protein SufD [Halioxenophilus aromaticivorans]|uniref:Fe-S cluster assembly protein SufD n=1 Tax=Halioxenophilus aromaticivorans TaxID=1306992 RepID=A0AAV3U4I7_9ALTE